MGALNFVRGSARVKLKCRFPERAVNICASRHVDFWDLERDETGATLSVRPEGYRRLQEAAGESGAFTVQPVRKRGAPFLLWSIRKRVALTAGLLLCLVLVGWSTLYIWQIDVTGNKTVSSARILAELRDLGVDIGASIFSVSQGRLSNEMLLRLPELCWITLNTHGSRIEVRVREAIPKPEVYAPRIPTALTARKAGVVTGMLVLDGDAKVHVGDAVLPGEELVSAAMPGGEGTYLVHARGEVWGRTWHEMSLRLPLQTTEKRYTGRTRTRTAVIFGGKRINFYFTGGNSPAFCDKMTTYTKLRLGDAVLPLTIVRELMEEYEPAPAALTAEAAERLLRVRLLQKLEGELEDGYALKTDFAAAEEDGVLTVTLFAECIEKISEETPYAP